MLRLYYKRLPALDHSRPKVNNRAGGGRCTERPIEHEELYEQVGARVEAVRKRRALSQQGLASKTGLSRASIGNIERGRQHPPLHRLYLIAEALDVEVGELLPSLPRPDIDVAPLLQRGVQRDDVETLFPEEDE